MDPIDRVLTESKTVAIVGLSAKPEMDSYKVGKYLQDHGYEVLPINPSANEIMGKKAYASLRDLPAPPDVVDVFRRADFVPEIVEDAIAVGAKTVWLQLGIINEAAAERARQAGLVVVMDKCMKQEHQRMTNCPPGANACTWKPS